MSIQPESEIIERKIKMPTSLTFRIDNDVKLVIEFILFNIKSSKRIGVINAVKQLAPLVFDQYTEEKHYQENRFIPIFLDPPNI